MTEENFKKSADLFSAIRDLKTAIKGIEGDEYSFIASIGLRRHEFEDVNSVIEKEIVEILNGKLLELEKEFEEI